MEIYLLRHGETGGNVAHRHQADKTQLSFVGEEQARAVAKTLKKYQPTHLISSSLVRAIETARIIGNECGLIPETSDTFSELIRPDFLYGHKHRSLISMQFYLRWYLGQTPAGEGESYRELRERITLAKTHLAQYPDDARIVVVTHSVFMNFFIDHLCREKPITPLQAANTFRRILTVRNTHLEPVCLDCDTHKSSCGWALHK